ncbi:kinectin isoform X2 [Denticeps clupeoides]|uniref:Ribosome receptor lysine/proline rich domain-containing protein n=1 Tax=Denticeps clupeoides TaxID=299321 RepID=A0AAY4ABG2_9TELE|nr:kinectin isoform X2 [Denticeps clupeoides]
MAVDLYDSQYLLILAPTLVIALMFLFFWLFMKETSYDEVLARQKRDLKLPAVKADARKKNEKKKSKKKDIGGGGGGGIAGGGGESTEDLRDFDSADATISATSEEEEVNETASEAIVEAVPALVHAEPPTVLKERKKKDKKQAKATVVTTSLPTATTAAPQVIVPPVDEPEVNGSKPAMARKAEQPSPVSKKPNPPSPQTPPTAAETVGKKRAKKQKSEMGTAVSSLIDDHPAEVKSDQGPPVTKKEPPVTPAEPKFQDGAAPPSGTTTAGGGRRRNTKKQKTDPSVTEEGHVQASPPVSASDSSFPTNHQSIQNEGSPAPGRTHQLPAQTKHGKKHKNEPDKENSEVRLKDLLSSLRGLVLSDCEAVSVISVLREKSPGALDLWYKSAAKNDPLAQQYLERERLLTTLQEESSIAKDKVKQLSQELQVEKQKTNRAEAVVRDQRVAMEKELGVMQAKAQSSYNELNSFQIKFTQMRDQLEGQIARLTQENTIFRDAVSNASNQMETKQTSELNKLRAECTRLMNELSESSNKLQQEEHQRKSLEVSFKQNVSQLEAQLQDAKRRWDEVQNYLHNVNTEREKLQGAKQELQNQLLSAENELNGKNQEIQTLHSRLTEAIYSKERVEQETMKLLEASKHTRPDEGLQQQVQDLLNDNKTLQVQIENLQTQIASQATTVSHFEELQKLLAEKEHQRKSLEDSLNAERSSGASRETNMQAIHNENFSLKEELQNLQAQISAQASSQLAVEQFQRRLQEKDERIKTVESLLESGLIEVANKQEEIKGMKAENDHLKREIEALHQKTIEQASLESLLDDLRRQLHQKDEKIRNLEEEVEKALENGASRGKMVETLEQQVFVLKAEMEQLKANKPEVTAEPSPQVLELQSQLAVKEQELQTLQKELEVVTKEVVLREQQLQQQLQQVQTDASSQELLASLAAKDKQLSDLNAEVAELRDSLELHRRKNNELREKNWSAMEALSATEAMLQGKLSKTAKEQQTAVESAEAECRAILTRLLPHVPLPTHQSHKQWLQNFESAMKETTSGLATPSEDSKVMAEKLREAEETQKVLQKDCETYKKVLSETEGILQRLQSSVEEEESRWRMKLDLSQSELKEMSMKMIELEHEVDRLSADGELDSLKMDKQHLEAELKRAERESAIYVSEVRELKRQLTDTLCKLETEENERQKVAGDLYKAQQSLELIQEEIFKTGQADLIENSSLMEDVDRKEKVAAGLNQTVKELQQLLQSVNRQLTKGQEEMEGDKDLPEV